MRPGVHADLPRGHDSVTAHVFQDGAARLRPTLPDTTGPKPLLASIVLLQLGP